MVYLPEAFFLLTLNFIFSLNIFSIIAVGSLPELKPIKEKRLPLEVTSKTHQRALLELAKQLNIELKVD